MKGEGVLPGSVDSAVGDRNHGTAGVIAVSLDDHMDVLDHVARIGLDGRCQGF